MYTEREFETEPLTYGVTFLLYFSREFYCRTQEVQIEFKRWRYCQGLRDYAMDGQGMCSENILLCMSGAWKAHLSES